MLELRRHLSGVQLRSAAPKMVEIIFTKKKLSQQIFSTPLPQKRRVTNFYNRDFIPVLYASHRSELIILNRGEKNSTSHKVVREIIRACLWHGLATDERDIMLTELLI